VRKVIFLLFLLFGRPKPKTCYPTKEKIRILLFTWHILLVFNWNSKNVIVWVSSR